MLIRPRSRLRDTNSAPWFISYSATKIDEIARMFERNPSHQIVRRA